MEGNKYQRLIGYNIWNVIAMGGGKKGGIKILGLKKISQYMAKQSCKNYPGA